MRSFLFKIFKGYFSSEIDSLMAAYYADRRREEKNAALIINYPVGTKIIYASNEPSELLIGEVVGYHRHQNSGQDLLMVESESKVFTLFSEPAYWTKEREDALKKLTWDERYNVSTKYHSLSKEDAQTKVTNLGQP